MNVYNEQKISIRQPLTTANIDLSAVRHNFSALQSIAHKQMVAGPQERLELIPVIKADAYGHGMLEVARVLDESGAKFFGVSNVQEGVTLREAGFKQDILLFEATLPGLAQTIIDFRLTPTVCTVELASALNRCATPLNKKIDVHVEIDTAMGRLGVPLDKAVSFIEELKSMQCLNLRGICTHFPSADSNEELTLWQIQTFMEVIKELDTRGIRIPYVHASNSMGLVGYKNVFFNLARPGLMLYGLYPKDSLRESVLLKPAMSVESTVIFIKDIPKGQGISYGHSFIAPYNMKIAVLPIGYNDGYLRALSNKAHVLIDGERCPVVGRVTMDQTIVDVTRLKSPHLGMPAVILGEQQGQWVTTDDLAQWAETINYEIICSLGNRLPRIHKNP